MHTALSRIVLCLTFLLLVAVRVQATISIAASADRNHISAGESVTVSVTIEGVQNAPIPTIASTEGFQAQYLGPSTQVSFVNGQMSASVTHRFVLIAQKEGTFNVGPFTVDLNGKTYEAPAIRIGVGPRSHAGAVARQAQGVDVLLTASLPRQSVWLSERLPLIVKLHVGRVRVDNLQFPRIEGDGFIVDKLSQPVRQYEVVNGRRYETLRFETVLTPIRAGELTIAPVMDMNVLVRRSGQTFFDDFFGDAFAERRPFQAQAQPLTLTVRPLPEEGKPADFSGAVGSFDFLLDVRPTEVNAGDPVTLRVEITGQGNLDSVQPPQLTFDDRFRVYDPIPVKDASQAERRVYEQVVIPRDPGAIELPAVRFSYFDPAAGSYRTITRGPVPLNVLPAASGPSGIISAQPVPQPQPAPEKLGLDIVYIKDTPGTFHRAGPPFYRRTWFLFLQLVPPLVFAFTVWFVRRREFLHADPRRLRFRRAGGEARRALKACRNDVASSDFYDRLAATLYAYLGAKLNLPPGAIEPPRIVQCLSQNGAREETIQNIELFFQLIEKARYAAGAAGDTDKLRALQLATGIVEQLESDRSLAAPFAALAIVATVSTFLVLGAQAAQNDPNTAFYEGNTAYKEGRFADAIHAYESVVSDGYRSAALHFNLGNAYFKAGQLGRAVLNYERARRLSPRDPDLNANLAYARELAKDEAEATALWRRLALPLAPRTTTGVLAAWTSLCWFALWIALGIRATVARGSLATARAALAIAILFVFVAVNFGDRLIHTDLTKDAVVIAPGENVVRFAPSESGTEYFRVREGTRVEISEDRTGWVQIRRRDGRRGWLPSAAVEIVG